VFNSGTREQARSSRLSSSPAVAWARYSQYFYTTGCLKEYWLTLIFNIHNIFIPLGVSENIDWHWYLTVTVLFIPLSVSKNIDGHWYIIVHIQVVLWIRPDPGGKNGTEKYKKWRNVMFEVLDVLFWGLKDSPVPWTSLMKAQELSTLEFWSKTTHFLFSCQFSSIFIIKTLYSGIGSRSPSGSA
jgi:hypothetical protein